VAEKRETAAPYLLLRRLRGMKGGRQFFKRDELPESLRLGGRVEEGVERGLV